jgi:hypothetical protein
MVSNRKAEPCVVIDRTLQISDMEDWLYADHLPPAATGGDLPVTSHVEPIEALVTDLYFWMRVELDGSLNRLTAT